MTQKINILLWFVLVLISCKESKPSTPELFDIEIQFLTPSSGTLTLSPKQQRANIHVVSNANWTVTTNTNWCTLETTSGIAAEKKDVWFTVQENEKEEQRIATLIFKAGDIQKEFTIIQRATEGYDPDKEGMESDARELAAKIKIGWNLGNTMETLSVVNAPIRPGVTPLSDVHAVEASWNNPKATRQLIDAVKAAGFNAVRIPCAWYGYVENDTDYTIKESWLQRVKEVVDYCIDNDMYTILNIHWDGGWHDSNCKPEYQEAVNRVQARLWKQIATYFRDYDERLIFAGANEPEVKNLTEMSVLKSYTQTFINEVRATGGRNKYRNLIIQGPSTNIEHTADFMNMAEDPDVYDRLMVEVHYYDQYRFGLMTEDADWGNTVWFWGKDNYVEGSDRNPSWDEEKYVQQQFQLMKTHFVDKGIPVILGEYGAIKRTLTGENAIHQENHNRSIACYLEYTTEQAKNYGLVPFYWDNGGDDFTLFNRHQATVNDPLTLEGILKGAEKGQYPY